MIEDIKERLRLMSSFVKQFLIMLALIGMILCFFQVRETIQAIRHQEDVIISEMQNKLQLANLYINYYADSIQGSLVNLTARDDLYQDGEREAYFVLNSLREKNELIKTLFVVDGNGCLKSDRQALYEAVKPDIVKAMADKAESVSNIVQYSAPFYSAMSAGYSIYASYREGRNIAVIEASCDYMKSILRPVLEGKHSAFLVQDRSGKIFLFSGEDHGISLKKGIYPLEVEDIYEGLYDECLAQMELCVSDAVAGWYFMYSDGNKLGWTVYSLFSKEMLDIYKADLYLNTVLRLGVWFLGTIVAVFWFTAFCARPIRRLAHDMDEVRDLEHLVEVDYKREDELIGRISQNYNRLVRRIRSLIEEVKESERKKVEYEFLMLQNQIGPHFLHNTLACIASLIRQGQHGTAQEALKALVHLLSYTFEQNERTVTLQEELAEIGNYMRIQQMRYGTGLQFVQTVESDAMQCRILRLILQPLVENSVFHGIAPRGEGVLRIAVRRRGKMLCIFICDDGVGMTRDMCRRILRGESVSRKTDRFSSVGILNVNERIRMQYGEKFGIRIKSEIGRGTIICLNIPQDEDANGIQVIEGSGGKLC